MRAPDFILEVLQLLLSPWSAALLVLVILFRREIRAIVSSLVTFADDMSHMEVRGLKVTSAARDAVAAALTSLTDQQVTAMAAPGGANATSAEIPQLVDIVRQKATSRDLALFLSAFGGADRVVVRETSRQGEAMARIARLGLVERHDVLQLGVGGPDIVEWRVLPAGHVLRSVWLGRMPGISQRPQDG